MEIDGVVIQLHHCHELFADEFGPYSFFRLLALVNTEDYFVSPLFRCVGYDDIMLIRHANTGDLEDGCVFFRSVAVKLVIGSIIFNPRRTAVGALVAS